MKVSFIGLGNVGGKLAGSLVRNGFDTVVHDLSREVAQKFIDKGAAWADSPKQMAEMCDVVITCLPSPKACSDVLEGANGVIEGLSEGKVWMEMSTTDADEVKRIAEKVQAKGAFAVECPVSGGCHRADTGNISIFVGGDREAFDKVLPLTTTLGRRVLHTGPLGTASTLKVMTNYLATANLLTCCEALTTMAAAGIDLATTYEAMKISSGTSFVHETESPAHPQRFARCELHHGPGAEGHRPVPENRREAQRTAGNLADDHRHHEGRPEEIRGKGQLRRHHPAAGRSHGSVDPGGWLPG
jgi:3-hydroxyisobutyrate dehydrogenase